MDYENKYGIDSIEFTPVESTIWIDIFYRLYSREEDPIPCSRAASEVLADQITAGVDAINETIERSMTHGYLLRLEDGTMYFSDWDCKKYKN